MDLPIPQIRDVALGTFTDDKVALSVHIYPVAASLKLQTYLKSILEWLLNWIIKANEATGYIQYNTFKLSRTRTE